MKLFWKSYAILFVFIILGSDLYFLSDNSPARLYYGVLITFQPWYAVPFTLNVLNGLLTLGASVAVLFYAFGIKSPLPFWRWLFFMRFFTDFTGHHYEWKFIQSAFAHEASLGFLSLAALAFPLIPSYIAHYRYAFHR